MLKFLFNNLFSKSFPIIRYRLGDYVELDYTTQCSCKREHPIIKEVTGRVGKVIYGIKDTYPSLTLYYVFKNLAMEYDIILNYQAVQKKIGAVDLYIEDVIKGNKRDLLTREFEKYFNSDLAVTIFDNANLKSRTEKGTDF